MKASPPGERNERKSCTNNQVNRRARHAVLSRVLERNVQDFIALAALGKPLFPKIQVDTWRPDLPPEENNK